MISKLSSRRVPRHAPVSGLSPVGGGYGVAVGKVFVIESMFFRETNASKIGFAVLAWHLAQWGFVLCDNKWLTPAMAQLRFKDVPRAEYSKRLAELAEGMVKPGRWQAVSDTRTIAAWRPGLAAA